MTRRRSTSESKQTKEEIRKEQTDGGLATPSSWWVERLNIEKPIPEDQERHYREEQERYEQIRQREEYYRPIQFPIIRV